MNKLSKSFLSFILFSIVVVSSVSGTEFGNIAVFVEKTSILDIDNISVQLEGNSDKHKIELNNIIVIWNIHPGVHQLNLLDHNGSLLNNISVNVFPNLTNKIVLSIIDKQFTVEDNGFADAAGHIFTFTQDEIQNIPGELSDGIGILGDLNQFNYSHSFKDINTFWGPPNYSRSGDYSQLFLNTYSYDGLYYLSKSDLKAFNFSSSVIPDLTIVNLSDPFGGYNNSEISLISNFGKPNTIKTEFVIGERNRKFYRGYGGLNLPDNKGFIFASVSAEDLGDAFPRFNVDDVLPHNNSDNSEIMAGAGINITPDIKSELRMFYQNYKRDFYDHDYYFNLTHAPREEGYIYRGKLSVFGELKNEFFFDTGFELNGDEYEFGDGLHFDDIESYLHTDWPSAFNPEVDNYALFWSWDDIDGVTPDIDEAHVYDGYIRHRTRGWKAHLGLNRNVGNAMQLGLKTAYSGSNYRKLEYIFPVYGDTLNMIDIGFDRFGNIIGGNGLTELPKPTQLDISLKGKYIGENYSVTGSIDYLHFDANVKTVKSILIPFGTDDPTQLEPSDMIDVNPKSKLGFRLAFNYELYNNITIYSNYGLKYYPPANEYLFNSWRYFEYRIKSGGSYNYSLSNPDLQPEESKSIELGISIHKKDNCYTLSYKNERAENLIAAMTITSADPRSYSIYMNEGVYPATDIMTFSFQRKGSNFFTCCMAANIIDFDFENKRIVGLGRFSPKFIYKKQAGQFEKLISRFSFDFSFQYLSGIPYTPFQPEYDPISLYAIGGTPAGSINSRRTKNYIELNLGLTATILKFAGGRLSIRGEVINVLNRENHLNVYPATGSPDETGWLQTEAGEYFAESSNTPHDSSGLTGEEKYILASDDPNNFGRPRMFRFIARLEF